MKRLFAVLCLLACTALPAMDNGFYIAKRVSPFNVSVTNWEPVCVVDNKVYEFVIGRPHMYHPRELEKYKFLRDTPLRLGRHRLDDVIQPGANGVYVGHVRVPVPKTAYHRLSVELLLIVDERVYRAGGEEVNPIDVVGWGVEAAELYEDPGE